MTASQNPNSDRNNHQSGSAGAVDLALEADFSLGSVRVKPSAREFIHANGVEVLEPRVMQVLVALARCAGQVVSRDQLIEQCWSGRVVGEDSVQRCIAKVRRLSETHGGFGLDTIARVGYRLTAAESATLDARKLESVATPWTKRRIAMTATTVALCGGLALGVVKWQVDRRERIQVEQTLSAVEESIAKESSSAAFTAAYPLSQMAEVRTLPRFEKLWSKIVIRVRPLVAEPGAMIYFKPYESSGDWIFAGTSPLKEWVEVPNFATLRLRIEKPGYRTGLFTIAVPGPSVEAEKPMTFGRPIDPIPLPLIKANSLPNDMVLVPHTDVPVYLWGWVPELFGGQRFDIPAFAIAKYEVTNREFKEFVDAGGYDDARYWSVLNFLERGRPMSWKEARLRFVDATNRPGPAGWQLSTYPSEQADYPVGGISWYEATAYARFRGHELPTIHHWMRAGFSPLSGLFYTTPAIAEASNLDAKALMSAHSETGLGPWGTYHMFGNVREWVQTFAGNDAVALGSAWRSNRPSSLAAHAADPMSRALDTGFRLMQSLTESPIDAQLRGPITLVSETDLINREPVSDEAFNAMRFQFSTAKLEPIEIEKKEVQRSEFYVVEQVTLKFSNEAPMTLHLAWPNTKQSRPLQAIIFGTGGNCCFMRRDNSNNIENLREAEFVANSGRVLVMPVWAGSYERFDLLPASREERWDRPRRTALALHRDLSTTVDYLESLQAIDKTKIGYIGYSRGATALGLTLAIESRVKAAVFVSGGVEMHRLHPMYDIVNYAPRITIPMLMLNGRYDHSQPFEKPQKRLFELLGSRPEEKRRVLYDVGHFSFGSNAVAAEASNWFDKYLGPVR